MLSRVRGAVVPGAAAPKRTPAEEVVRDVSARFRAAGRDAGAPAGAGARGPPPLGAGAVPGSGGEGAAGGGGDSDDKMINFMKLLARIMGRDDEEDLLRDKEAEGNFQGAKGAVAFARERNRFKNKPMGAWNDFESKAMEFIGILEGQPWRCKDLIPRLPFGSHVSLKRAFMVFCEVADALKSGKGELALGLLAQAMRWIAMALAMPQQPDLAWQLCFLPDPRGVACAENKDMDWIQEGLQDPRQLTAVIGLRKDMQSINSFAGGKGDGRFKEKDEWKKEKDEERKREKEKEKEKKEQERQAAKGLGRGAAEGAQT